MSEILTELALLYGVILTGTLLKQNPASLFFHIRNDEYNQTTDKVETITNYILSANKTQLKKIGFQPQCVTADFNMELQFYSEFTKPVMATVLTSDVLQAYTEYKLTLEQIDQIRTVCPLQTLRIHEAISYYRDYLNIPFPTDYVREICNYAQNNKLSIFWNEWDINTYPQIAQIIEGYENTVHVSFGTNANYIEPIDGFNHLKGFTKRAASIQSWYWYERQDRTPGTEMDMPPELMRQHTLEALRAGCTIIQYEPYWYFFDNITPYVVLNEIIGAPF